MSRAYIIQRAGHRYRAASLETLTEWIRAGRVRLEDHIKGEDEPEDAWRRCERDPSLKALFPYERCYQLKRGERVYQAHELSLLVRWAREGKISADDELFVPAEERWCQAVTYAPLREALMNLKAPHAEPSRAALVYELTAPLYDSARLFLLASELTHNELTVEPCEIKSYRLDRGERQAGVAAGGLNKRQSFELMLSALELHLQTQLSDEGLSELCSAHPHMSAQLQALQHHTREFTRALREGLPMLNLKAPERFVVGSAPTKTTHPDELTTLNAFKRALTKLISSAATLRRTLKGEL